MPVALLAVTGLIVGLFNLPVSANPPPSEQLVTLEGAMGSQARFFEDERVGELLLRHNIRVHVTRKGSIDAVMGDLDSLDFVFASGQPPAEFLVERGRAAGENYPIHRVFVSPIVLATDRDYAETLWAAGVATPQATPGFDQPYYYNLDMGGFLNLVRTQKSWDDLNGRAHGVINSNQVLAQTPGVCESNSGASYVGLISYVVHRETPRTEEAAGFAATIKPLISPQGLPPPAPEVYFLPEGRQIAPIIVLYEHQYLAHQLDQRNQSKPLDGDRVLLYPDPASHAYALFVALNERADRLGRLLLTDPDLRKRAVELGMQVLPDSDGGASSEQLSLYLAERGVPVPSPGSDTEARLPDVSQLKEMIDIVGDCRTVVPK